MLRCAILPCLLLALALPLAAQAAPTAQASKSCNISGKQRDLGATYVTSLSAKRTSCGKAEGLVKAYHACRGSGKKCGRKVNGYKCRQKILAESPVQYDAKVTCKNGGKVVKHVYTQNT
jgi:hypothetical protein